MAEEITIGIDLGTTFSVVSYVDEEGHAHVVPNAEGKKTTPSVVLIEDGRFVVGEAAANQAIAKKDNVVQWIKRSIGDVGYTFLGYTPVEISAEILKKLKHDTETELGVPISKAVITCPAYFTAVEVENTRTAGELAGFDVQEIVKEPTAAAVYFGAGALQEGEKLLVCDLGGGTYDASLLTFENGTFRPMATAGDRQLGGHDWTMDLLEFVADELTDIFGTDPRDDPIISQKLYDDCERAKRDLTRAEQVTIACVWQDEIADVTVTREEFEEITEWRLDMLKEWTAEALAKPDPPVEWSDINYVLLVGGSVRMPSVIRAIEELSGQTPIQTAETDTMVAMGAAVLAKGRFTPSRRARGGITVARQQGGITPVAPPGGITVAYTRIAERNLGTKVIDIIDERKRQAEIKNSIIIPWGSSVPAAETRTDYRTLGEGQEYFDVPIVEFDDTSPEQIQDTWRFFLPARTPKDTSVHVTFKYDVSGIIDVSAVEKHSNTELARDRVEFQMPDLDHIFSSGARYVVFAIDVSSSMDLYDHLDEAKRVVTQSARGLLEVNPSTQIGIVAFGSRSTIKCSMTSEFNTIKQAVAKLHTEGSTNMADALTMSIGMLSEYPVGSLREIVMVSDGMPDNQDAALRGSERAKVEQIDMRILGIGESNVNYDFLTQLTPDVLVIDRADQMGGAMAELLALNKPQAGSSSKGGITWGGQ